MTKPFSKFIFSLIGGAVGLFMALITSLYIGSAYEFNFTINLPTINNETSIKAEQAIDEIIYKLNALDADTSIIQAVDKARISKSGSIITITVREKSKPKIEQYNSYFNTTVRELFNNFFLNLGNTQNSKAIECNKFYQNSINGYYKGVTRNQEYYLSSIRDISKFKSPLIPSIYGFLAGALMFLVFSYRREIIKLL